MVLSGILVDQAEAVSSAYSHRFDMQPPVAEQEWVSLEGRRKAD